MKESYQLLDVLKGQLETCRDYLSLLKKKTESLVVGDIKSLDSIVRVEQAILMKMESFDRRRNQLLMNAGLKNITISELIADHITKEEQPDYQEVFDELSVAIEALRKNSALNERLLKQRLSVVNSFLNGSMPGIPIDANMNITVEDESKDIPGKKNKKV